MFDQERQEKLKVALISYYQISRLKADNFLAWLCVIFSIFLSLPHTNDLCMEFSYPMNIFSF